MSISKNKLLKKILAIDKILAASYGLKKQKRRTDPTSELILTILSQNTNDQNRDRAYDSLKSRFPTWADIAAARPRSISDAIQVGGLANIKSHRIKKILNQIGAISSDYSLSFLKKMPDRKIREFLQSFNGVGPKTAACVLLFSLGRNAMPVDTHVFRVGLRLGMIPDTFSPDKAHRWFIELNLPLDIYQLHLNMIQHGRRLCRPLNPRCSLCPLTRHCLFLKSQRR